MSVALIGVKEEEEEEEAPPGREVCLLSRHCLSVSVSVSVSVCLCRCPLEVCKEAALLRICTPVP